MTRVLVEPRAARQVQAADRGWRAHHPARPGLFAAEWSEALGRLQRLPRSGAPDPRNPRQLRLLLRATQYYLYYFYFAALDLVVVQGVRSCHQRPK